MTLFRDPEDDNAPNDFDDELAAIAARDAAPDEVPAALAAARAAALRKLTPREAQDFADVEVPCSICREPVQTMACIVAFCNAWNAAEIAYSATTEHLGADLFHKPDLVGHHELVTCPGACTMKRRAAIQLDSDRDWNTTMAALKSVREKRLDPQEAAWLRKHGYSERVKAYYSELNKPAGKESA